MGALFDLLKEVPLSAVLKEKIAAMEAENGALSTENAILKDDNRKLQAEIIKLKDEIERLTHTFDLDEPKKSILVLLAKHDGSLTIHDLEFLSEIQRIHLDYHLHELAKHDFVGISKPLFGHISVSLHPLGTAFIVKNNLI